jgi:hypothetical protein
MPVVMPTAFGVIDLMTFGRPRPAGGGSDGGGEHSPGASEAHRRLLVAQAAAVAARGEVTPRAAVEMGAGRTFDRSAFERIPADERARLASEHAVDMRRFERLAGDPAYYHPIFGADLQREAATLAAKWAGPDEAPK